MTTEDLAELRSLLSDTEFTWAAGTDNVQRFTVLIDLAEAVIAVGKKFSA